MSNKFLFLLLISVLSFIVGCDKVSVDSQDDEMARFNAWIEVNNLSNYKTPEGIYYINAREGTGITPEDSNIIVYSYVVRDLDGVVLRNTYKDTAKLYDIYGLYKTTIHYAPEFGQFFSKNVKPKGLADGLGMMKEGGKARLIMPSSLAYGKSGDGGIDPYTSLIYDIELIRVFRGDIIEFEQDIIDEYTTKYPTFVTVNDSIYYKHISSVSTPDKVISAIEEPAKGDTVYINFTGSFLDGFIFDTNIKSIAIDSSIYNSAKSYKPMTFVIGDKKVVTGFDLAVRQMVVGDSAIFILPSKCAYGSVDKTDSNLKDNIDETTIPAYSPLVFKMKFVKLTKKVK